MSAEEESPGKKSSRRRVVLEVRRALCGGRFRAISLIVFLIFDPSFFFFSWVSIRVCFFLYCWFLFLSFLYVVIYFWFNVFFLVYHHSFLFLFCFFVSFIVHFFLSIRTLIPRWGLTAVEVREALRGYINKHDRPFDSSKAYVSYQNYWPLKKLHSGAG